LVAVVPPCLSRCGHKHNLFWSGLRGRGNAHRGTRRAARRVVRRRRDFGAAGRKAV